MKYPISPKDKAAIYFLLKRLVRALKLSSRMKRKLRSLRMKFTPGPAPVQLKPLERDQLLNLLYPIHRVGSRKAKPDLKMLFHVSRVIQILERNAACLSTSNTEPFVTETTLDPSLLRPTSSSECIEMPPTARLSFLDQEE